MATIKKQKRTKKPEALVFKQNLNFCPRFEEDRIILFDFYGKKTKAFVLTGVVGEIWRNCDGSMPIGTIERKIKSQLNSQLSRSLSSEFNKIILHLKKNHLIISA